jgi:hypothetical protein
MAVDWPDASLTCFRLADSQTARPPNPWFAGQAQVLRLRTEAGDEIGDGRPSLLTPDGMK